MSNMNSVASSLRSIQLNGADGENDDHDSLVSEIDDLSSIASMDNNSNNNGNGNYNSERAPTASSTTTTSRTTTTSSRTTITTTSAHSTKRTSSLQQAIKNWKETKPVQQQQDCDEDYEKEQQEDATRIEDDEDVNDEENLDIRTELETELSEALHRIQNKVKRMGDECKCGLCLEILVKATVLSPCGHSFCRECFFASKMSTCPVCRAAILAYAPNLMANNFIATLLESSSSSSSTSSHSNAYNNNNNDNLVPDEHEMGTMAFTLEEVETFFQRTGVNNNNKTIG